MYFSFVKAVEEVLAVLSKQEKKKKKKKKKSPLKLHFFNRDFRGSQQNYKVLSLGYISKSQGAFKTEAWAPPPAANGLGWISQDQCPCPGLALTAEGPPPEPSYSHH